MLSKRRRTLIVPDSRVLYRWGFDLMNSAARQLHILEQLIQYRDGLLIAMLAAGGRRAPRNGGSAARQGVDPYRRHLLDRSDARPSTKRSVRDAVALPAALTPFIEHYLATVRPQLDTSKNLAV